MQLTRYTDYSLRVLIYLASGNQGASVAQIAEFYGISYNHLTKVVAQLSAAGVVESVRGRGGGLHLATDPADICIGDVVRSTENLALLECFDRSTNQCPIASDCALETLLHEASRAFLAVLDARTLADLMPISQALVQLSKRGPQ
jgi:Rrf2 family nitric oxide-sensitive transcriptional repressor